MTSMQSRPTLFAAASRIGFGCASLGSRVGERQGLAALAYAYENGVTWFDLAPSYGDGQCESIFAKFAKGRRERIFVCTKVGIAPPALSSVSRLARPLARTLVRALPGLRTLAARGRPAPELIPITGQLIAESIEQSLRRLGMGQVDVLALHDPQVADLEREDVASALERMLREGKARAIGVAGTLEAARRAVALKLPIAHVQISCEDHLRDGAVASEPATAFPGALLVTHSVARSPLPQSIEQTLARGGDAIDAALRRHGFGGRREEGLRRARLAHALATNRTGVVLNSMFSRQHVSDNLAVANSDLPQSVSALARDLAE